MDQNTFENYTAASDPISDPISAAAIPTQGEPPVHTGIFFGLEVLFSIPLIGLISSIIFSFAPKNKNLKNYARAKMIWCLISLLITVVTIISCVIATQRLTEYLRSQFALDEEEKARIESLFDTIDNIGELAGIINSISSSEDIAGIIGQIGGMENIGEIIEQFGGMENLGEIIEQVGDVENIEEFIEQAGGIENIEEIVDAAGGIENFGEIVEAVGGIDQLSGIDSIEDIKDIAEEIDDPEAKDRIMEIIRQNGQ